MKNCAGVFFVLIMSKQLSDEEDESNHTRLICSNNAYPKVNRVIPCLPWPLRSTAGIILSQSLTLTSGAQGKTNLPKLTTANLVAVSLTTLEFTMKKQFPLSHFVLAVKCTNRKFSFEEASSCRTFFIFAVLLFMPWTQSQVRTEQPLC